MNCLELESLLYTVKDASFEKNISYMKYVFNTQYGDEKGTYVHSMINDFLRTKNFISSTESSSVAVGSIWDQSDNYSIKTQEISRKAEADKL